MVRPKFRGRPASRMAAMTLVELLAATALAAVLMTAVAGVLRLLAVERRALDDHRTPPAWKEQLLEQLRWDLANSRSMRVARTKLQLTGYAGCDFQTGAVTHRPAEVIYELRRQNARDWLVRRELHQNGTDDDRQRTELVCDGVGTMTVRCVKTGEEEETGGSVWSHNKPLQWGSIPDRLQIVLRGPEDKDSEVVLDEVFCLR